MTHSFNSLYSLRYKETSEIKIDQFCVLIFNRVFLSFLLLLLTSLELFQASWFDFLFFIYRGPLRSGEGSSKARGRFAGPSRIVPQEGSELELVALVRGQPADRTTFLFGQLGQLFGHGRRQWCYLRCQGEFSSLRPRLCKS